MLLKDNTQPTTILKINVLESARTDVSCLELAAVRQIHNYFVCR